MRALTKFFAALALLGGCTTPSRIERTNVVPAPGEMVAAPRRAVVRLPRSESPSSSLFVFDHGLTQFEPEETLDDDEAQGAPTHPVLELWVVPDPDGLGSDLHFDAAALRNLRVSARWYHVTGPFRRTFELYDPMGNRFDTRGEDVECVTPDEDAANPPEPGRTRYVADEDGSCASSITVPIAGTIITDRHLFGVWTAVVVYNRTPYAAIRFSLQ